jgi:hypothetical protein
MEISERYGSDQYLNGRRRQGRDADCEFCYYVRTHEILS